MKVGFPIIGTFTGYMAVIGLLAALHRRRETGRGDFGRAAFDIRERVARGAI